MSTTYDREEHFDALFDAQDALRQLVGEVRGDLDQDPEAFARLTTAVERIGAQHAAQYGTELTADAVEVLAEYGFTVADWARANGNTDGVWRGDRCGCPDNRCAGHHHDEEKACGCLEVLLEQFGEREAWASCADAHAGVWADAYMDASAGEPGATAVTNHEPSTWLADQITALNDRIEAGTAHHCRHLVAADQDSLDMARFAALWKPGVVACLGCVAAGAFRMGEDEAGRCDRCGRHAGALAPFLSRSGDFIVHFKLCVDCGTREGAPAPDTTENGDHA